MTRGVYRHVRHPMYASITLWGIGHMLLLPNWLVGPAALWLFLPMLWLRVPREEAMMLETFGEQYRDYMARTGRLFPRMRGRA